MIRVVAILAFVLCLAGCGGGGGGGGGDEPTSIAVAPTQLTFVAPPGELAPAQRVTVDFVGDGVLVSTPSGDFPPGWIGVTTVPGATETRAQFDVQTGGLVPKGDYRTTLRFYTGRLGRGGGLEDAKDVKFVDVPVLYTVRETLRPIPAALSFNAVDGSSAPATPADVRSVQLGGEPGVNWTASSNQAWLQLPASSGTLPSTLAFSIVTTGLAPGVYNGVITVTDVASGERATLAVTLTVRAPRMTVAPTSVAFTINGASAASDLQRTLLISDELGGTDATRAASWRIASIDVPWLQASVSGGSTSPAVSVGLSLVVSQVDDLADGHYAGTVNLRYSNADSTEVPVSVAVTLDLAVPALRTAAPYASFTGGTEEIILAGKSLGGVPAARVLFGSTPATSVRVLTDGVIAAQRPVLPAGTYGVQIINVLGSATGAATMRIVDPQIFTYSDVMAFNNVTRMTWDPIRKVLYTLGDSVGRFAYQNSTWTPLGDFGQIFPSRNARLSRDYDFIYMPGGAGLFRMDLRTSPATTTLLGVHGSSFCSPYAADVAPLYDDRVVVLFGLATCSGSETADVYEPVTNQYGSYNRLFGSSFPFTLLSDNGVFMFTSDQFSGTARLNTVTGQGEGILNSYHGDAGNNTVSRDGRRGYFGADLVANEAMQPLGTLPLPFDSVAISPDGAIAYTVYGRGNVIRMFDLTRPPANAANAFPELGQFAISTNAEFPTNFTAYYTAISPDGNGLFMTEGARGQPRVWIAPVPCEISRNCEAEPPP